MLKQFYNFFIALIIITISLPAFACAVCYTDNGLSGASIAVIVIISSFLILFFANKILQKILNKD